MRNTEGLFAFARIGYYCQAGLAYATPLGLRLYLFGHTVY